MPLIKSITSLRDGAHLNSRAELRVERLYRTAVLPIIAPIYLVFAFVDYLSVPDESLWQFVGIRAFAIVASRLLFLLARGRTSFEVRAFVSVAPYIFVVEYLMFAKKLAGTSYFGGVALVVLSASMLFPMRLKRSLVLNYFLIAPIFLWVVMIHNASLGNVLNIGLMSIGVILLSSLNSSQLHYDLVGLLQISEGLARDRGKRDFEIRRKAEELLRRKIFETQFSPQVVTAVLENPLLTHNMQRSEIVTIVIDIENSTVKASKLPPENYKRVLEEVLDVFSAACLRWDVTLDKFTGDGVQAFLGAPVAVKDGFERALATCKSTIEMLDARRTLLSRLWEDTLNVRFAVCEGEALVGFIGRGIFKSYTAVGETVSFTHRLSSVPPPWSIAAYSWKKGAARPLTRDGFNVTTLVATHLKGFGDRKFTVLLYTPELRSDAIDAGRCPTCETPLVIEEQVGGLPNIYCPGCKATTPAAAGDGRRSGRRAAGN